MARKRLKRKKCACPLCKPGKRGQSTRWKNQELERLQRFEKALNGSADWGDQ